EQLERQRAGRAGRVVDQRAQRPEGNGGDVAAVGTAEAGDALGHLEDRALEVRLHGGERVEAPGQRQHGHDATATGSGSGSGSRAGAAARPTGPIAAAAPAAASAATIISRQPSLRPSSGVAAPSSSAMSAATPSTLPSW